MTVRRKRNENLQIPPSPAEGGFDLKRWTNNWFSLWRRCEAAACKRKRGCAGDAQACFDRWWPVVPERLKMDYRATITAFAAGASAQEAVKAGDDAYKRFAEDTARTDALLGANHEAEQKCAPLPSARMRTL